MAAPTDGYPSAKQSAGISGTLPSAERKPTLDFLSTKSLMNFILPTHFARHMAPLRAIFKAKGDAKVTLLAQERVSRAKKMMIPFVLRRRKDQVRTTQWSSISNLINTPSTGAQRPTKEDRDYRMV
jgi:hypothetical protein